MLSTHESRARPAHLSAAEPAEQSGARAPFRQVTLMPMSAPPGRAASTEDKRERTSF
jgi:hypothetical protein